jgi:hypothetical protein
MDKYHNKAFRRELRALVAEYLTPKSSFIDHWRIVQELEDEAERQSWKADKFPAKEVNAA